MALDKQGILNELGSVMNKLQSADCGCMGKLFSNSNGGEGGAMCNPQSSGGGGFGGFGCRGGCCHGRGGFNFGHGGGEPCMGNCNPRKIYADTYNYLSTNLMQPTVNEVYNDLKTITPENTVMNNSMAANMGLSPQGNMQGNHMTGGNGMQDGNLMQGGNIMQGGNPLEGGSPMQGGHFMGGENTMSGANPMFGGNSMQRGNAMEAGNIHGVNYMQEDNAMYRGNAPHFENDQGGALMQHNQMMSTPMGNQMQGNFGNEMANKRVQQMMGGMGPNIVDMMKSGGGSRPMNSAPQNDQMPGQMLIDAPQSPHGKVGVTPLNVPGGMYSAEGGIMNNSNQHLYTPTTQYVTGADMASSRFNPSGQNYNSKNMQPGMANPKMLQGMTNPNMQQGMTNPNMQQDMTSPNMQQGMTSPSMQQVMTSPNMQQGMTNPNMQQGMTSPNMQQGMTNPNVQQNMTNSQNFNPSSQQMASGNRDYGQHSQGMKKFNEMFPGVMGGDLGFDPMAIAVQMNPENHKRAAMDQMNKMMSGNKGHMSNAFSGFNAAKASLAQENVASNNQQNYPSNQQVYGQSGDNATPMAQNQQYGGKVNAGPTPSHPNQQQAYNEANRTSQQPAYAGAPTPNQEQVPPQQQYQYQQQMIDPNSGVPTHDTSPVPIQGNGGDANAQHGQQGYTSEPVVDQQLMIQDPIFPADTSSRPFNPPLNMRRQRFYQYNTLGQPVHLLPAKMYHSSPETNLPQTLYPSPPSGKLRRDMSGNNLKATVSKTSLMGNKPIGGTPSRSQLQNIYHQYKGSHSNTQQNIRNPAGHHDTSSEGKLGVQKVNTQLRQAPVERVGGDSAVNNRVMQNLPPVKEMPVEPHGDVPAANKPHGDTIQMKEQTKMQGSTGNVRNGLQDMVYTAYPTSAAWTFHGDGGMPYSTCYRGNSRGYRGRA